ncbi:type II toxin-antitoxin system Phd/YefM family antitoxin [Dyadobacter aurulentus]|uniref:hypothetical protein n=1 Tax=Dyadobacter sp. UC 10 TaxID=2605428 RepID=UPI0011F13ABB|nr:hypothetical protein [Dyadobacter sp. UC 10]KAA0991762.1 hypothetical protein FXO21_17095 [Dyadobacter sp. UC 10]
MLRLAVPSQKEKRAIRNFLRTIKTQKESPAQMDTTDYLMSDPRNRELLLKAIDDVKNGKFIFRDLIEP